MAGKKSTVRARLRAGGARPPGSWRPPAEGRAVGFLNANRARGPLWAERLIPRADARAAGDREVSSVALVTRTGSAGNTSSQIRAFQPSGGTWKQTTHGCSERCLPDGLSAYDF